ncbi:unnamed protein product [Citrullus colocynthis]|uniref:Uncharacterized protein n=1 Tax=Citrullus colocynthis TaxID=252529 RepID=A0ABP0YL74_9ROSI
MLVLGVCWGLTVYFIKFSCKGVFWVEKRTHRLTADVSSGERACSEIWSLIFQPPYWILLFPSSDSETNHHSFKGLKGVYGRVLILHPVPLCFSLFGFLLAEAGLSLLQYALEFACVCSLGFSWSSI